MKPARNLLKIPLAIQDAGIIGDTGRELGAAPLTLSIVSSTQRNGHSLTRDELTSSYAIIRHNVRTYQSGGVLVVVTGKHYAESELRNFEDSQESSDRHEGWRYFIEKTTLKAGTDPAEATQLRQAELEGREAKALRDTKTPTLPGIDPKR